MKKLQPDDNDYDPLDLGQFRPPEEFGPPTGLDRETLLWAFEQGADDEDEAREMIQKGVEL